MDQDETEFSVALLMEYRRLWVKHQTEMFLYENPQMERDEVYSEFLEKAIELFEPVETALLEGLPLRDAFETAQRKLSEIERSYE